MKRERATGVTPVALSLPAAHGSEAAWRRMDDR